MVSMGKIAHSIFDVVVSEFQRTFVQFMNEANVEIWTLN